MTGRWITVAAFAVVAFVARGGGTDTSSVPRFADGGIALIRLRDGGDALVFPDGGVHGVMIR